mgnify:CR=1 FL=1
MWVFGVHIPVSSRTVRIHVFIGRPLLLVCGSKQFANVFRSGDLEKIELHDPEMLIFF